jgi:hypothetical protein
MRHYQSHLWLVFLKLPLTKKAENIAQGKNEVPEMKTIGVRKKRWIVCFENTILDLDLSIYGKMVYIALCAHAKKDGPCFPSIKTIAEEASCSRTKVL